MKLNDYEVQHYHFIIEGIQSCELIHSKLRYVMLFQCQIYPDKLVVSTFLSTNLLISSIKSSQEYLKRISVCVCWGGGGRGVLLNYSYLKFKVLFEWI